MQVYAMRIQLRQLDKELHQPDGLKCIITCLRYTLCLPKQFTMESHYSTWHVEFFVLALSFSISVDGSLNNADVVTCTHS